MKEQGWKDELSAALIGSCTNSSYEDMTSVADLARQAKKAGLKTQVPFLCTPGSEQIRATIERDQVTSELENIGATVLANACGPCIGQVCGSVRPLSFNLTFDDSGSERRRRVRRMVSFFQSFVIWPIPTLFLAAILTSFNRNFKSRNDGNKLTMNFLASPTVVTAMAFSGKLSFNPMTDSIALPSGESFRFTPPRGRDLPETGFTPGETRYYPTPTPEPQPETEVVIRPDSQRLEILAPFSSHFGEGSGNARGHELPALKVLMRVRGKCTTDHISAAVRISSQFAFVSGIELSLFRVRGSSTRAT